MANVNWSVLGAFYQSFKLTTGEKVPIASSKLVVHGNLLVVDL